MPVFFFKLFYFFFNSWSEGLSATYIGVTFVIEVLPVVVRLFCFSVYDNELSSLSSLLVVIISVFLFFSFLSAASIICSVAFSVATSFATTAAEKKWCYYILLVKCLLPVCTGTQLMYENQYLLPHQQASTYTMYNNTYLLCPPI